MRYFPFVLLLPFSLSLPLLAASTANAQLPVQRNNSPQEFWSQAERLVQHQLNLITRIERAIASPDFNRVKGVRSQLFLHLGTVDRFLKSQYPIPSLLCSNGTTAPNVTADLTLPQRDVYCALYASTQQLEPMVSMLEQRLPMLAGLAASNPLSTQNERPLSMGYSLQQPAQPRWSRAQEFPVPETQVIGLPAKTPIAEAEPPFQPAIAPSQPATRSLQAAREPLLAAMPAMPASVRILDPAPSAEVIDRLTYGLSPLDFQRYAEFLSQPNTGIARVLLAESYHTDPNRLRNRVQPTVAERFPFVPLVKSSSEFTPRFALQIEGGNFQIPMSGVDYGFIANLGEVSLEKLDATLEDARSLSDEQREFFLNYVPPNQLEALQEDRRRLVTGKDIAGLVLSVSSLPALQAPVVLNNTYLVRLFQFQLPEVLLTDEPISRAQRRYLDEILETPSSDVLVAFRPVSQRLDGSYIVLWRLLNRFPDPKIADLDEYLQLE